MTVFNPRTDLPALRERLEAHAGLRIACYCAAWCDTCTQYRPAFEELARRMPEALFLWIDIEDDPEWLGDEDVENFPTLLLQDQGGTRFWGTQLPHIQHLERLARAAGSMPPVDAGPGDLKEFMGAAA
ncbi:thioredoxin family protein [Castellaniella sp. GW247-6E4]|uniref:thioredoxin family protein n=1 Tax=Castellaniella sp. GW247-6E4 TaxID=3140380 RepID=UPI003316395A